MDASGARVRRALRIQGYLLFAGAMMFSIVFPLVGGLIWATGFAPGGEAPGGPAFAMTFGGPVMALLYLPGAVISVLAADRHAPGELGWVIAATVATVPLCSIFGGIPLAMALFEGRPAAQS